MQISTTALIYLYDRVSHNIMFVEVKFMAEKLYWTALDFIGLRNKVTTECRFLDFKLSCDTYTLCSSKIIRTDNITHVVLDTQIWIQC